MIKNENIICISSIDWDFIWQGHQEIMATFARNGNRVLFIENTGVRSPKVSDIPRIKDRVKNWFKGISGIRKEMENLYIFSPLVLPFPYSRISRKINLFLIFRVLKKWFKVMDFDNPVIWTFLPTPLSLKIIDNLSKKIVIYYCIDNFSVSSGSAKKIKISEIKLLKEADLVFVTSKEIYNYCSKYNSKVFTFPFTVNFQRFEKERLKEVVKLEEFQNIKKPVIGYIGGVHKWIDQNLIKKMAEKYVEYSFVIIGPIQTDISLLSGINNVYFLGKKDHKQIPYFIKNFDVCIIPYLITDYTKNVYPTKLNEYHAMGKPVVSTNLPEIVNFNNENENLVFIGNTYEEFAECISIAIKNTIDELVNKRIESARKNSWDVRIEEMSDLLEDTSRKKVRDFVDWKDGFIKIYRSTRRKIVSICSIVLLVYLLIFHTPLTWIGSYPLKISHQPEKADCIVVFAGGVGESGKAGQGYQERVKYAVDLYTRGYAKHMIFSSGYMYIFHEPLVMKGLAMSLDVPDEAIILEDKATSTYQNVKYVKEILDMRGWDKILLVSSPFHMKRASMVFNQIAKNIKVLYTPIPHSGYYNWPRELKIISFHKQITRKQIIGVIHEYLAIIYYWWKGWI